MQRIIAHIDMDAFFASVEERDRPEFKGLPIVIGSDPKNGKGRGVVSTANYEARKFGIHSAMPISKAWKLAEEGRKSGSPATIFLEGNHRKYSLVSKKIMDILRKYSEHIEEASIDEAYIDLSHLKSFDNANKVCLEIKKEIFLREKLTSSIGLSNSKLVAKIASDMKKPDGLTIVRPEDIERFLEPLYVRKIPGIGPKTENALSRLNIKTIRDIKNIEEDKLKELFGKWGVDIFRKARGIDDSQIIEEWEAKSIGEQETFDEDTLDANLLMERIKIIAEDVFKRFERSRFKTFKTIAITVRFSDFSTKSRAHTLDKPSSSEDVLVFETIRLFMPFLDGRENPKHYPIRLIGVRVEKLV